jgi:hypothetical protein
MLRPFLLIVCLLLSSSAFAQKFDWVKSIDGFTCYSSAVDREQNVVCVGGFEASRQSVISNMLQVEPLISWLSNTIEWATCFGAS